MNHGCRESQFSKRGSRGPYPWEAKSLFSNPSRLNGHAFLFVSDVTCRATRISMGELKLLLLEAARRRAAKSGGFPPTDLFPRPRDNDAFVPRCRAMSVLPFEHVAWNGGRFSSGRTPLTIFVFHSAGARQISDALCLPRAAASGYATRNNDAWNANRSMRLRRSSLSDLLTGATIATILATVNIRFEWTIDSRRILIGGEMIF